MNNSMKTYKKEGRNYLSAPIIPLLIILFLLTACVNRVDEEGMPGETTSLHVTTRAGSIPLPYPIHIYAFDAEGKQAAMSIVNSADESCSLTMAGGSYHLVALAGTDGYNLPDTPVKTSSITLHTSNYSTTPLMMGSADVTLGSADEGVDIMLTYRVARIELSLSDIPVAVKSVKVSFSPLYNAMNFGGSYTDEDSKAIIACSKEGNNWKAPIFHTFPGSGQTLTLTIEMTDASGSKSYGYTYEGKLEAGIPYVLTGSYKQGFSVNGSITAEGWGSAKNIGFTFGGGNGNSGGSSGETPDPGNNDTYPVTAIPETCTLWNGHAVVAVQNTTATTADLLLLSLKEWKDVASAKSDEKPTQATTLAAAYNEGGISGWRIPTKDEADLIKAYCGGITLINEFNDLLAEAGGDALTGNGNDSHGESVRYLCDTAAYSYDLKSTSNANREAGGTRTYYLRTVKTVHVTTAH